MIAKRTGQRLEAGMYAGRFGQDDEGAFVAITVRPKDHPDWIVVGTWRVSAERGALELVTLSVEPYNAGTWPTGGLPSTVLEDIRVRQLRELLHRQLAKPMGGTRNPAFRELVEVISNTRLTREGVGSPKPGRRRAARSVDERQLRAIETALTYEGHAKPNVAAAKDSKLRTAGYDSPEKVRDLKQAAARKGWTARPGKGRSGYTLTSEGLARIKELDQ